MNNKEFSIYDLKTGNVINYHSEDGEIFPHKIDWQDLKWLEEDPKGFNMVHSPIKLAEEHLLLFGFSDKDYKPGFIGIDYSGNVILDFVLTKPLHKGEWQKFYVFEFADHRFLKFDYLHEFQNFFYSITQIMPAIPKEADMQLKINL